MRALPAEPRTPCLDADTAEEEIHRWLMERGVTDRQTLWCGTLAARATVWVAHARLMYQSDRFAEGVLKLAKLEVKKRLLRFQIERNPFTTPGQRLEFISQHNAIDYTHLPPDMTKPPPGWLEVSSATAQG